MHERMARVETKLDSIEGKLDKFIDNADKRYASKLTESIVYALCGAVLLAFVTKIIHLW